MIARTATPPADSRHRTAVGAYVGLVLLGLTGCAPATPPPLANAAASPAALAQQVLDALAAGDEAGLAALAIDEREFREIVWPELPASRPERGVPLSYAWGDLHQKSSIALRGLVHGLGGRRFTLLDVGYDGETTEHETFRLHRETRLRVLDEEGEERSLRLFGSTLVRGDEHKVFSYVID